MDDTTASHGVSSQFRKRLRDELQVWQEEGIVDQSAATRIHDRYDLGSIEEESRGAFLNAIYAIGVVLIGGGIFSFIAANWSYIPAVLKWSVLFVVMFSLHGVGFYFWKVKETWTRLGHWLVTLGTVVFIANIFLLAQIYHLSGAWYGAFAAAALGALTMALGVRSWTNAFIAAFCGFLWFVGYQLDGPGGITWYPYFSLLLFGWFAVWQRSAAVFILAWLIAIWLWFQVVIVDSQEAWPVFTVAVLSMMLTSSVARTSLTADIKSFLPGTLNGLSLFCLTILAYMFSFADIAADLLGSDGIAVQGREWPIHLIILILSMALLWFQQDKEASDQDIEDHRAIMASGAVLALTMFEASGVLLAVAANLVCLLLVFLWVRTAIERHKRIRFWSGVLLAGVFIVSRFFEYTEGLVLKAAIFVLCGAGLIYAAIRYERYLAHQGEVTHE